MNHSIADLGIPRLKTGSKPAADIKRDLSPEQLAAIGAVTLAYNYLDVEIDALFRVASGSYSGSMGFEIATRLAVDQKIELIKIGAEELGVGKADREMLGETLGEGVFKKIKAYRDAVVHCVLFGSAPPIGLYFARKAKVLGTHSFKRAVELAQLPGKVTPHTLRHTAATWLMQRGVPIWEAAGFLGMSVEVLQETYGHHHPDYLQAATAAIGQKGRFVSVVETVVGLTKDGNQNKKPN